VIDLHFHCLPGLDDGPRDWNEAFALLRLAEAEGTTRIVATPHVLRSPWLNVDPAVRLGLVDTLNERLKGRPEILPGCEFFYSSEAFDGLELGPGGPLTRFPGGRYALVEFDAALVPSTWPSLLHELKVQGVVPILAHPERNAVLARDPDLLEKIVAKGSYVQVTAGSLLGEFGPTAEAACGEFFRRRIVHLVASDAHSLAHRPPRLKAARSWVRKSWGETAEKGLFRVNPEAVLAGKRLPYRPG
jgi:protein-tyrosine phosphatase